MRPHAVVILTGDYGRAIFEPVFGADGWQLVCEPTKSKHHGELGTFLIHTYHPERKKGSRKMADIIARAIVDSIRQHQLRSF